MSRIDYIFCNANLSKCLQKAYVKVAPVPDHKAVVIHLRSSKTSRGPGYWKLNSSALKLALKTYIYQKTCNIL